MKIVLVHVGGAQEYVPGTLASAGAPGHSWFNPLIEATRNKVTRRAPGRIIFSGSVHFGYKESTGEYRRRQIFI